MTPRFVDADYIAAKIRSHKAINSELHAKMVEEAPEVKVTPMPDGKWIYLCCGEWMCTNCRSVITTGGRWDHPKKKHCEECGAKMVVVPDD